MKTERVGNYSSCLNMSVVETEKVDHSLYVCVWVCVSELFYTAFSKRGYCTLIYLALRCKRCGGGMGGVIVSMPAAEVVT